MDGDDDDDDDDGDDDDDDDDEGSMMTRRRRRGGAPRVVARLTVPAAGDGAPSEAEDAEDGDALLGETTLRLLTAARGTGSRRGMTRAAAVFSSTSFLSVIMPYPLAESVVFADDDVRGVRGAPPAPAALVVPTTSR